MDIQKIEQLIEVVKGAEVSEITLESDKAKVKIRKGTNNHRPAAAKAQSGSAAAKKPVKLAGKAAAAETSGVKEAVISAPMVGIFHSFNGSIAVGSVITSGQTVGSIESMKLMNDITADADGTVAEVLVEDGMPVEYGQALLRLVCN